MDWNPLTQHLGTKEYVRVRVGIGRPPGRMDPAAYVLRQLSARQRRTDVTIRRAADAVWNSCSGMVWRLPESGTRGTSPAREAAARAALP